MKYQRHTLSTLKRQTIKASAPKVIQENMKKVENAKAVYEKNIFTKEHSIFFCTDVKELQ